MIKTGPQRRFFEAPLKIRKYRSLLSYFSCFFDLRSYNYERSVYCVGLLTVYEDTW